MFRIGSWVCRRDAAVAVFMVMATLLTGCVTSRDRPNGQVADVSKDSLMLVFVREFSFDRDIDDIKAKGRILDCVRGEILRLRPKQRIVSFDEFRRTAFPDLSPESAPRNPKYLSMLLQRTDFRDRIQPLGIRHIAFIGGVTKTVTDGGIACVGAYAGVGCFGLITWDKKSRLGASVLDLNYSRREENLEASASGTAWFAIVGVFPIGVPSVTGDTACKDLGVQIARFLASEQNPAER